MTGISILLTEGTYCCAITANYLHARSVVTIAGLSNVTVSSASNDPNKEKEEMLNSQLLCFLEPSQLQKASYFKMTIKVNKSIQLYECSWRKK